MSKKFFNRKLSSMKSVSSLAFEKDLLTPSFWAYKLWAGLNNVISYILLLFASIISYFFFFILNKTTVKGKEKLKISENTLFLANHQSMIDSFVIGGAISFPGLFLHPRLLPYHPAAKENFFSNAFISFISTKLKCIPVKRGQHDFKALETMTNALKSGTMLIYPEGKRSRNGNLGKGRPGTGKLIHDTKATCIPIKISGMNEVLPIGKSFPRIFKNIEITIGDPIEFGESLNLPSSKTTSEIIIAKVMDGLNKL